MALQPGNSISMHGKSDNTVKLIQQIAVQSLRWCHCSCQHLQVSCHRGRIRNKKKSLGEKMFLLLFVWLLFSFLQIISIFSACNNGKISQFSVALSAFHGRCQVVTQTTTLPECWPCPSVFELWVMVMVLVRSSHHYRTKRPFFSKFSFLHQVLRQKQNQYQDFWSRDVIRQ